MKTNVIEYIIYSCTIYNHFCIFQKCKSLFFFLQSLFYSVETSFAYTRLLAGFIYRNIFVFIEMKGEMIFFQSFFFYSFGSSDEFLSSPCSFDSCFRSFTDEISFKLSHCSKNLNDKFSIGRSSIKSGFRDTFEENTF